MSSNPRLDQAFQRFNTAFGAGRLAQAYLVMGNVREEGAAFAEKAVQRLFCGEKDPPCGQCVACRHVEGRLHPDVVWIEPEKKSRVVGIDRIRELQRLIYQTSYAGGWKAAILVSADRLGADASNAFLKTLEEPPARCLFLLLTDSPQSMLATILSRCQRLALSAEQEFLPEPWNERLLEVLTVPLNTTVIGRIERTARLERLLADMRKTVEIEEKELVGETDMDDETLDARIEARYRGMRTLVIRAMMLWYRDILVCVCGGNDSVFRYKEQAEAIRGAASGLDYRSASANLRTVQAMQRQWDRNLPGETVVYAAASALTA